MGRGRLIAATAVLLICGACAQEEILEGERLGLRAFDGSPEVSDEPVNPPAFVAPAQQQLSQWTHRAGNPQHRVAHAAFSSSPALQWSASIGAGDSRKHRITADPVVAGGRVFAMDSRSTVTAVSTGGQVLWSHDLTPSSDREDDASGGGLATDGTRVFATSGFGRLTALSAETGEEIWTQKLGAAATSAPTVVGGIVYAVSTDSRAWAVDAETGRVQWEVSGAPSPSGVIGAGAPAVTDRMALLPFHSGELVGALKVSGLRLWTAPLSGGRKGRVYARITDVTGDPVVVGDTIYAGNPSGKSMAVDIGSGDRIWTADEGTQSPPWVAGGSVFVVSDENQLVRLDAATGQRIWGTQLPYFTKERVRRRKAITDHYGPILAGGQLIVVSGDGQMRFFDPSSGAPAGSVSLPGGAASLPAVVDGTLYVVGSNGRLHAYR
ncbi:MAG: PQQ-binding-like beta-propeller repeat protein [Pseudomonadota bacterium]